MQVRDDGHVREVNLKVVPLKPSGMHECCFLVLFEESVPPSEPRLRRPAERRDLGRERPRGRVRGSNGCSHRATRLRRPKDRRRPRTASASWRTAAASSPPRGSNSSLISEQHDAANEELKTANEEILSSNEELQSTNEELETAKEELQSVNEELTTVNEQLQNRNQELTRLNDDSTNLLGSGNVPMVVLGIDLRIRRFTPAAGKVLNLHSADVGRPIGDLRLSVDVPDLEPMLLDVIASVQIEGTGGPRSRRPMARPPHPSLPLGEPQDRWRGDGARGHRRGQAGPGTNRGSRRLRPGDRGVGAGSPRHPHRRPAGELGEPVLLPDLPGRSPKRRRTCSSTTWVDGDGTLRSLRTLLKDILPSGLAFDDFEVEHEIPRPRATDHAPQRPSAVQREGATQRILLAFQDVTERERKEQELRESQQALEEADRRKNEFLAMLAHELRNPLAAISSAVQVSNQAGADAATAAWSKEIVERQIKNLARLIDDLLDISRVTQGKVQLRKEPVDIGPIVARAVEVVRPHIDVRKHELSISLPEEPVRLQADPTRLEQVLVNLLSNAAKFTDPGGRIGLEVRKQGIGIDHHGRRYRRRHRARDVAPRVRPLHPGRAVERPLPGRAGNRAHPGPLARRDARRERLRLEHPGRGERLHRAAAARRGAA